MLSVAGSYSVMSGPVAGPSRGSCEPARSDARDSPSASLTFASGSQRRPSARIRVDRMRCLQRHPAQHRPNEKPHRKSESPGPCDSTQPHGPGLTGFEFVSERPRGRARGSARSPRVSQVGASCWSRCCAHVARASRAVSDLEAGRSPANRAREASSKFGRSPAIDHMKRLAASRAIRARWRSGSRLLASSTSAAAHPRCPEAAVRATASGAAAG